RPPDRKLRDGNDALGLVADVDEHFVLVDANDGAVHDLALLDRGEGRLVVGDELAALRIGRPDAFLDAGIVDRFVRHVRRANIPTLRPARPVATVTLGDMEERYPVGVTPSCVVAVLRHDGDGAGYAGWSATIGLQSGEATMRVPGHYAGVLAERLRAA